MQVYSVDYAGHAPALLEDEHHQRIAQWFAMGL